MKIFNSEIIEKFTERCPDEIVERVINISTALISKAIEELKIVTPTLYGDFTFAIVDDHYFDTSTVNSNLTLFVIFNSPQLELNTYNLVNNKFKQFTTRLKYAWLSTRKPKKRRAKKLTQNNQEPNSVSSDKYTIINLKQDLAYKIAQNIDKESYVQITKYGLKLVSKKDLGVDVNIYPVIETQNTYKLYNSFKNTFFNVNFKDRENNFNKKVETAGDNFVFMARVFNNLYYTIYNIYPNQILIESILYNVPDSLFKGYTFYESFVKVINFLNNANYKNFVSITDNQKNIFNETLIIENPASVVNGLIKHFDNNK